MFRSLQKLILTIFFTAFAAQASAMFVQPDWFEVTEPGVGTNRYAYCNNDPINCIDPTGNVGDNWATEDYPTAYDSSGWTHTYNPTTGGNQSVYNSRNDTQTGQHQNNSAGTHTISVYDPDNGIDPHFRSGVHSAQSDRDRGYQMAERDAAIIGGSRNAATMREGVGYAVTAGSFAVGAGEAYVGARAAIAAYRAGGVAKVTSIIMRPHGNSKSSAEPQVLYNLIDTRTLEIQKIGIAGARVLNTRYSDGVLARHNVALVPVARYRNRITALAVEAASIAGFRFSHGHFPPQQFRFGK